MLKIGGWLKTGMSQHPHLHTRDRSALVKRDLGYHIVPSTGRQGFPYNPTLRKSQSIQYLNKCAN